LFDRVIALDAKAKIMSKSQVIIEYKELDLLRCQATAFAESKCRIVRTEQVAFSPELNAARLKIKVWLLLVSKAIGRKVSSRLISRSLKKSNIALEARSFSEDALQEHLKTAYQEYYKIKGSASKLRQTALENLAEAIAA
jgi:hypothetical protein